MTQPLARIGALDAARGAAVVGMIVFHAAWDLHWFGFVDLDPSRTAGWRLYGHGVATTFLFLSGFSLVLARRRGRSVAGCLRRVAQVGGAALLVSAVTAWLVPERAILFGILHCIAVGGLIGLGTLRLPVAAVAAGAAAAALLPLIAPHHLPAAFWWIGLSDAIPDTLDYRPVLPWLAPVLLGTVAARLSGSTAAESTMLGETWRPLRWAGRHSLAVYLLHQPLLVALLVAIAAARGSAQPWDAADGGPLTAAFLRQCRTDCESRGADEALCRSACLCMAGDGSAASPSPERTAERAANCVTRFDGSLPQQ